VTEVATLDGIKPTCDVDLVVKTTPTSPIYICIQGRWNSAGGMPALQILETRKHIGGLQNNGINDPGYKKRG
jgi:hypothetical protein